MKLEGKRVLITGGAGGLGLAMAADFASRGARLALADINAAALASLTERFPQALLLELDVTDEASIQRAADRVGSQWGGLDVLVNNAGIVFGGELSSVSAEQHRRTVDINLTGTILVTRAFVPLMEGEKDFRIVFIASASGYIPLPMASSYASSKWAVRGFASSLSEELRLRGFAGTRVLTVCPSYIGTGLFEGARAPLLTPILETEAVSRAVVRAVQRKRTRLDLPWSVTLLKLLHRLWPYPLWLAFLRLAGISTSMVKWTGRGKSAGEK